MEDIGLMAAAGLFVLTLGGVSFWAGAHTAQHQLEMKLEESYYETESLRASIPHAMEMVCRQCGDMKDEK